MSRTPSPRRSSSKRVKLENDVEDEVLADYGHEEEVDGDHCSICLQLLLDRTVIPECSHEFCFECIVTWTDQSRRCPLCTRTIGPYLIHHIRSNFDYQKYHLPPLRTSPPPIQPLRRVRRSSVQRVQEHRWGRRLRREQDVADELERAIDRRRWVYHNHLYVKHVASNTFTRYRPFPTPAQFSASQDYISRATIFIRRELRVWVNLDVEFLTTFILSLMKVIDIRSESAIKLLAEFLDMDHPYYEGRRFPNAEHFAHELYSFLRSPYKSLSAYDMNAQYDTPEIVNKRANRDRKTASEKYIINEPETPLGSELRHHTSGRSPPLDGNSCFGPRLKGQDTNHNIAKGSSGAPPFQYAENHVASDTADANTPLDDGRVNGSTEILTPPATDERFQASYAMGSSAIPSSYSELNSKGKQRASPIKELEPRVTDGHSHGAERIESPRSAKEVQDPQSSTNTSVASSNILDLKQQEDLAEEQSNRKSTASQVHLRSRNPLLIAQAHLLDTQAKLKKKQPRMPSIGREDCPSEHRRSSRLDNESPSLLSRITDPKQSAGRTGEAEIYFLPPNPLVVSQNDLHTHQMTEDLHMNLASPLEAERAVQATREHNTADTKVFPCSADRQKSSPDDPSRSIPNNSGRSGVRGGGRDPDLESKARTRARLKMKLAVEKHLHAPHVRTSITDRNASEEQPRISENRERMLRAVLESRRRGGQ
ncbi:uncharacterized protein FOMMEDRAFT_22997 [Fomitiporia mediterranea MF3/22]|uniref:uncharacterized protein n=1 Tax=Fomitiporia mediterranea (strain MF3/22) TaxID=694068 RepID=UPI0004408AAF|nr:uncharacterized protein FOMMEDRAFT_22997 [Fomitiporia mediterranea MF3/22]EJC99521.1 hypothetical protein FOMMEDRAFT_22997 [Fomitiporia mediterranea MF3/22]